MPPKDQTFFIKSYLNGLCLDVDGGSTKEGAKVIMWHAKPVRDAANQLWYVDPNTNTIRNSLTGFCLEVDDHHGFVSAYNPGNPGQKWTVAGQTLVNVEDMKCLDIVAGNDGEGADVCGWARHGKVNQRWYFENVPRRYFHIVSDKNGKVMDIKGADASDGAELIIWPKHDEKKDNQLFFCGRDGLIKSKMNGFVFDSQDGDLKLRPLKIRSKHQGFIFSNRTVVNVHDTNKVMDIKGGEDDDGTPVCEWDFHGGVNQRWRLQYV